MQLLQGIEISLSFPVVAIPEPLIFFLPHDNYLHSEVRLETPRLDENRDFNLSDDRAAGT